MSSNRQLRREFKEQMAQWKRTAAGRLERYAWAFTYLWGPHVQDVRDVLDELYTLRKVVETPLDVVPDLDMAQDFHLAEEREQAKKEG
jgi:hypothetical protein